MNIGEFLESRVSRHPDKVYLYFEDQEWTYQQFNDRVNQAANAFLQLDIHKGDRVCLMLPNCPEFLFSWLGLNKIGGIMVPINTAFKVSETQYIVEHCEAKGIVAAAETLEVARSIREKSLILKWIALVGNGSRGNSIDILSLWTKSQLQRIFQYRMKTLLPLFILLHGPTKRGNACPSILYFMWSSDDSPSESFSKDRLMVILPFFHMPMPNFIARWELSWCKYYCYSPI
jgi:crotonobetaine/carnitine-CoA ligase